MGGGEERQVEKDKSNENNILLQPNVKLNFAIATFKF